MWYNPSFRDSLHADIKPSYLMHALGEEEIESRKFGLPRLKKFPMPDAAHVKSAIKFFNYVTPANEKELARNILARMDEYGINPDSLNVGDNNRFKKYLQHDSLMHHGIKGMKWGVRRFQNADGSLTDAGKRRISSKQSKSHSDRLADICDKFRAKGKTHSVIPDVQFAIDASKRREDYRKFEANLKNEKALREKQELKRREAYEKAQKERKDAFRKVYGKDAKVDYMRIYNEMSKELRFKNLLDSEDPDDYRVAEAAWRKKHGV